MSKQALVDEIQFFRSQDADGDGSLSLDEYLKAMLNVHEDTQKVDPQHTTRTSTRVRTPTLMRIETPLL